MSELILASWRGGSRVRMLLHLVALIAWSAGTARAQTEVAPPSVADTTVAGANRLFFAPNGRTLPGGVTEAGAYLLFAPYLGHAFHDRFMIAAGTPILPEAVGRYWYIAPKVGIVASRLWNVAGGALVIIEAGANPLSGSDAAVSFLWGVVTYGSRKAAVTVGLTTDMGRVSSLPDGGALIVGGEYQLMTRGDGEVRELRLIAESYAPLPTEGSAYDISFNTFGLRFGSRRAAFELVAAFSVRNGNITTFAKFPLFHVSFYF